MEPEKQKIFSPRVILILILILLAVAAGVLLYLRKSATPRTTPSDITEDILIGFSMSSLQEERWQTDKKEFLKKAQELGVSVDVQASQNDVEKQISQIRGMIAEGVNVLVVVPYDAEGLADVINEAHAAGIKVISYDRLIKNANPDLYLSFDNEKVGEYQAQYVLQALQSKIDSGKKVRIAYIGGAPTDNNAVLLKAGSFSLLQPLIDAKKVEIVVDKPTTNWNPDVAYKNLKEYLDRSGGLVDAVIAANDGTAFGSITALKEHNLAGVVPVSGQDAELAAIKRLVSGTQTVSVYKPISKLAARAVELAIEFAKGKTVETTRTVNNGLMEVPSVLLAPIPVTKNNIRETIVSDGYHRAEDIYNN
ncbi:MAG: substrate-binding domain-containing protein [Patescibacteria group bacterium]